MVTFEKIEHNHILIVECQLKHQMLPEIRR